MPNKSSQKKNNNKHISPGIGLVFLGIFLVGVACYLIAYIRESVAYEAGLTLNSPVASNDPAQDSRAVAGLDDLQRFASENDFKKYLTDSGSLSVQNSQNSFLGDLVFGGQASGAADPAGTGLAAVAPASSSDIPSNGTSQGLAYAALIGGDWFSSAVGVANGIERADIAKTDGNSLFFSPNGQYYLPSKTKPGDTSTFSARQETVGKTHIIGISAPGAIKKASSVDGHGDIMLFQNIMAVFAANQIIGYDVTDPANPNLKWKVRLDDASQVVDSFVRANGLYLVIRSDIDFSNPCPLRPILDGDNPLLVACDAIYHPAQNSPIDSIFTVLTLDAVSGKAVQTISFVGSREASEIYASGNYIYAAWSFEGDPAKFFSNFIAARGQNLVPDYIGQKISKLAGYDLTAQTKLAQINFIFQSYSQSLSDAEASAFKNDFGVRLADYSSANSRDLDRTAIAKVGLDDFKVVASGEVPGHPVDALSLNEYNGNLRAGVGVGQGLGLGLLQSSAIANDIYILDDKLQVIGSALNLGFGQPMGSVRFDGNAAYLATARAADPIYLVDISDVSNAKLVATIDLPAAASYLRVIADNKVLIISKDNLKTRLSLFDVSLPSDPKLLDKYQLDEYWNDIDSGHPAFYQDAANNLFFVAAGKGGYVFGYTEDKLKLAKTITGITPARTLAAKNYLYLIGDDRIVAVDEGTLEKVSRFNVK